MERKTKNAKIEGTMLGVEDHGVMTGMLYLDYGGTAQGAGGYCLDTYDKGKEKRVATRAMGKFVKAVLDVVGVEKWEDLKGKHIRVDADWGKVYRIGHFLEEKWLDFDQLFKEDE